MNPKVKIDLKKWSHIVFDPSKHSELDNKKVDASPVLAQPSHLRLDKLRLEIKKLAEQIRLDPGSVLGKLSQNPLNANPALVNS